MRHLVTPFAFIAMAAVVAAQSAPPSQHHADVDRRGAHVMGFDQQKTVHHFYLYPDGGAIEVLVRSKDDTTNLDAIRSHLPHIAAMFTDGRFDAPMLVHATEVPGTAELAKLKDRLTYAFKETPLGGRVDVRTTDADAIAALHRFLRFQIADHRTGDSPNVTKR